MTKICFLLYPVNPTDLPVLLDSVPLCKYRVSLFSKWMLLYNLVSVCKCIVGLTWFYKARQTTEVEEYLYLQAGGNIIVCASSPVAILNFDIKINVILRFFFLSK